MLNRCLIVFMMIIVIFSAFDILHASTSALDNLPGGAGIAYWQAGAGWSTLINIQADNSCAQVHGSVYDSSGLKLYFFNLRLRPSDNVGIVVNSTGFNTINLYDYSDTAYGGTTDLNDFDTGPPVTLSAPEDSDGIIKGYMTFVKTNLDCAGLDGRPNDNITGQARTVPNSLWIRTALVSNDKAFALNAIMFQDFANIGDAWKIDEAYDFINTSSSPNSHGFCDFSGNVFNKDIFLSIDDAEGADIDFAELFLTDNITEGRPWIVCDPGPVFYKALGSQNNQYCARYNRNPAVGTQSKLILIAPQSNHPSANRFPRDLYVQSFNDKGNITTWGPTLFNVVEAIPFGGSGINIGTSISGESCFMVSAPVFGFVYTENASFADIYPLERRQVAINIANKTLVDTASDIITLP